MAPSSKAISKSIAAMAKSVPISIPCSPVAKPSLPSCRAISLLSDTRCFVPAMATIEVETIRVWAPLGAHSTQDGEFRVRVIDGRNESSHRVTLTAEYYKRLTDGKIEP